MDHDTYSPEHIDHNHCDLGTRVRVPVGNDIGLGTKLGVGIRIISCNTSGNFLLLAAFYGNPQTRIATRCVW